MITDKFQELVAGAMALIVIIGVVTIAGAQALGYAHSAPPDYLLVIASTIAAFYYGQRSGTTKLNGNVSRLADAVTTMANAAPPPVATIAVTAASAPPPVTGSIGSPPAAA